MPTPRDAEIREAYARFAAGDVEGALRLFSPNAEVRDIREGPGCLLVTLLVEGRGRISGAPIDQLFYHVLRFAGERVTAFEWYTGRDEGVGAAGLR